MGGTLPRVPIPPIGAGAAGAGGGAAGAAATASSGAATAGAIAAGIGAFGAGFAVGDAIAGSLGIKYPGGKNAIQYFFGGKDPGIGATGAASAPITANFEGDTPPFTGGQMPGVFYRAIGKVKWNVFNDTTGETSSPEKDVATEYSLLGPVSSSGAIYSNPGPFGPKDFVIGFMTGAGPTTAFFTNNPSFSVSNVRFEGTMERQGGLPDTGGNPPGLPEPRPIDRRTGAPLPAKPTPPAPTPTITPTAPPAPAPATPGDPVNPPEERPSPGLPWWAGAPARPADPPASGLPGSPATGSNTTPLNNPKTDSGTGGASPPPKAKTGNDCRCNIPLFNKLNDLDKKITGSLGGAGLVADGGILAKLNQMQNFAEKAWEATRIQKVLDALTLVTVLHNASMISRDVGETLGYALSQALDVLGIDDEEGNALDVNGWFGTQANNFFENLFGADRWHGINETWNKANRIISSATMIVWTLRSIHDGTQEVLEWTAENTGKIGNALKKWGVVGERAYPWMSENVKAQDKYRRKFSRILDGLEAADDTASSYAMVVSEISEITQEVGELGEQRQRFTESVRDLEPGAYPDNSEIPLTNDDAAANATAGPEVTPVDMEPASNGTP